jgi:putative heme-binding domain-containing protein
MRTSMRFCLLGLCASVLALGSGEQASAQSLGDHTYTSDAIEAGSRVYVADCALCHERGGAGVDGVNLRLGRFSRPLSDEDLRDVVTTGFAGGRMPAFTLSEAELNGIVAYIRAGFDPSGVAVKVGDAARGRAVFQGKGDCASCHRVFGQGPHGAPDLSEIGAIRTPATLQRTLLDPASSLRPIDRPVRIVTRDGETITGRRLNEDTYSVQLIDSNQRLRSLLKADLREFEVSTTPTMQPTTLTAEEVADVIGYLLSLQGVR